MKRCYKMLLVCTVLVLLFLLWECFPKTKPESFAPQNKGYINYNNYVKDAYYYGHMDYCDGILAYKTSGFYSLFKSIVQVGETGEQEKLKGVTSPFQLAENGIVYIDKSKLIYREETGKETVIDKNADSFTVYKSLILYERISIWDDATSEWLNDELYVYDLVTGETGALFEDLYTYVIYQDYVYATDLNDKVSLYKISLSTREKQFVCHVDAKAYPYSIQIANNTLIRHGSDETNFYLLDLITLQESTLPIYPGHNKVEFVCEGDTIYYSYEGIIMNGSFVYTDKKNEHNGTWKLNMVTGAKEQISHDYYDELYCFDQTHLYGYNSEDGITEKVDN